MCTKTLSTEDDQTLINSFLYRNNQKAFNELYSRYKKGLENYFTAHLKDQGDLDELLQTTFLKISEKLNASKGKHFDFMRVSFETAEKVFNDFCKAQSEGIDFFHSVSMHYFDCIAGTCKCVEDEIIKSEGKRERKLARQNRVEEAKSILLKIIEPLDNFRKTVFLLNMNGATIGSIAEQYRIPPHICQGYIMDVTRAISDYKKQHTPTTA